MAHGPACSTKAVSSFLPILLDIYAVNKKSGRSGGGCNHGEGSCWAGIIASCGRRVPDTTDYGGYKRKVLFAPRARETEL
jgi:hypothetical protein